MDYSNSSSSPQSSDSYENVSHFIRTPSNANNGAINPYEMNVIFYNTMKKLKTENNSQPCVVKKDHRQTYYKTPLHMSASPEFTQASSSIPYLVKRPQNIPQIPKQNKPNLNLENYTQNIRSMNGKRAHPEFAFVAPRTPMEHETMKRLHQQRMINKRPQMNKNIITSIPAQNILNGMQRPSYDFNDVLFNHQVSNLPNNPISQAAFLYQLEQQLKNYNELAKQVQYAQNAQIIKSKLRFNQTGKNILPPNYTKATEPQQKLSQTVKRCLIEEVTASERNFKQAEEHLEKRHKANFVTKLQPGKESKVFEFSSTKFNLTITGNKDNKEQPKSFRKTSGQFEEVNGTQTNEEARRFTSLLTPSTSLPQTHNQIQMPSQFRNAMMAQKMLNWN